MEAAVKTLIILIGFSFCLATGAVSGESTAITPMSTSDDPNCPPGSLKLECQGKGQVIQADDPACPKGATGNCNGTNDKAPKQK